MECPRCKSDNITHSHRRGVEKVLGYLWRWYVPYRCKECWTRFWVHEKKLVSILTAGLIFLLLIASVIGGIIWWQKTSDPRMASRPDQESMVPGEEKKSIIDQSPLELPDEPIEAVTENEQITEENLPKPEDKPKTKASPDKVSEKPEESVAVKPEPPEKKPAASETRDRPADTVFQLKSLKPTYSHDEFKMTIQADEPIQDYKAFALDDPPRLVLNLKGNWKNKTKNQMDVDGDIIRRIRIGEHADRQNPYLSIVLDAEPGISLKPKFEESSEGLILILGK